MQIEILLKKIFRFRIHSFILTLCFQAIAFNGFSQYSKLLDFAGTTNGEYPYGSLISDGTFLYGMTQFGGANNMGTIYKVMPDGTGYVKLLDFSGAANGRTPYGSLFSDGTFLYGMTAGGGTSDFGVLFKIKPDGTGYVKLLDFTGVANGSDPEGALISDGTFLYGATASGGTNTDGTIFKIKPDGTGYVKLFDFANATSGHAPRSLISDGTFLYGMTLDGGANFMGTVFKIKPDGTGFTNLLDFAGATNGSGPYGDLITDGTFLYGMTSTGGTNNLGTIFKIKPDGSGYVKLLDFAGATNGKGPHGSLTYDGTFLYGMTEQGGNSNFGVIFKVKPDGTGYTKLLDFTGTANGSNPYSSLFSDGTFLYGTTVAGGANDLGAVFKYRNTIPTISSFTPASGAVGTSVVITGTNFNSTPANNIVYFGATQATVSAATPTQLTVTVPLGATYAPISVLVGGLTVYSGSSFIVTFPCAGTIDTNSFAPKVDFTSDATSWIPGIVISDFDGDGKPDFAVTNNSTNSFSVFRNVATPGSLTASSFSPNVNFTTGTAPRGIAVGDLDGDGKPDVVVTNHQAHTISVFRNTSSTGAIDGSSFAAKVDFATGLFPNFIEIADLDLDGKLDLVSVNIGSNSISIFRNTSTTGSITTGSFAAKVNITAGTNPLVADIGDLDNDGKPDIVVSNSNSNSISVFKNVIATPGSITSGSFAAKVDFATASPDDVVIGDLDGDGKPEITVANWSNNYVSVFRNASSTGVINAGSFSAAVQFVAQLTPESINIADLDGDGKPDLSVLSQSDIISLFKNTSSVGAITAGSFAAKVDFAAPTIADDAAIGDLDGDGKPDLIISNYNNNTLSIYRNTISSGAAPTISSFSPTSGSAGTLVTITGTNFDLTPANNIVKFNGTTATVTSSTATSITATVPAAATTGSIAVTIGCNTATSGSNFSVLVIPSITSFSPTSGPIGTSVVITGTNFSSTPANNIVYFGATQASIISATSTQLTVKVPADATYRAISVLVNGLTAYSEFPFTVTFPNGGSIDNCSFAPKVDFNTGTTPGGIVIGDFDGDGKSDLALVNQNNNTLSTYLNTSTVGDISSSSFASKVDFPTMVSPTDLAIGDMDSDGKLDLVVVNMVNTVSVFLNTSTTGTISFATKVDYTIVGLGGSTARRLAIGDLDGDGKPDVAVPNGFTLVSVLKNQSTIGNVAFASKVDFSISSLNSNPLCIVIGDLNGDAKPEMAVTQSNTISVLRNISTVGVIDASSFAPYVGFATGTGSQDLALGDLDGDSKPDFVTANRIANSISVIKNTSTTGVIDATSFAAKVDFIMSGSGAVLPHGVAINDVDGDGKPEIAVARSFSSLLSVFKNSTITGVIDATSFATQGTYSTGATQNTTHRIAAGDLDGDGAADLALVNNKISIFRNTTVALLPTISSFSPTSGPIGTIVTITGTNFDLTPANNIVQFNGTAATVSSSSATSIITTVPLGATTGLISVQVGCNTAMSTGNFTVGGGAAINISLQPSDFIACVGDVATFTTSANGTTNITYQWQFSPDGIVPFADIANGGGYSNVSTATLSVNTQSSFGSGRYRCRINGDLAAEVITNDEGLFINALPAAPGTANTATCFGTSTTINASGGGNGQYRWYTTSTGGTAINGEVNSAYTTPALSSLTTYYVSINNGTCESLRTSLDVSIAPLPSAPTTTGASACAPTASLVLNASGGVNGQYRWYTAAAGGIAISGEVNSNYTTPTLGLTTTYYVAINDGTCESLRTAVIATIQICNPPAIAPSVASAFIEGIVTIDLTNLISDADGNLDPSSLQIIIQPASGAVATLSGLTLTIDYTGLPFAISESITLQVCDFTALCTTQQISINFADDINIYNAVSPNGDGKNEFLFLQYIDVIPDKQQNSVGIYNRWGDEVFFVKNYNNADRAFSGYTNDGSKLPAGTYFYKISFESGESSRTGYLELKY